MASATTADAFESPRLPIPHPEEPLLYQIPTGLYPAYRQLSVLTQLATILLALWTSAVTTWARMTWLQPLAIARGWKKAASTSELLSFAAKTILLTVVCQTVLKDIFARPSRVPIQTLLRDYFLPSPLSNYEKLSLSEDETLGVHFLKYESKNVSTEETSPTFDAIYMNHGFGASSLSWLPVIPSLTERLGAKLCLAHDAPGFGFTDRPENLELYTTTSSARIAKSLLLQTTGSKPRNVALFGHSLGTISTLKMALQLPKETTKFVVLCDPALGLIRTKPKPSSPKTAKMRSVLSNLSNPIGSLIRKGLVYPIGGYALRKMVGTKGFWRKGLENAVWGDPKSLRDSDELRYKWPSIGAGWEKGLMEFSRAQLSSTVDSGAVQDDKMLFQRVLELPNTRVLVVHGSSDRIMPSRYIRNFLQEYEGRFSIVELEGLGHDPFEEDAERFCSVVEDFLENSME